MGEGSTADQDMTPNGKIKSPGIVLMLGNQQTPERSTLMFRGASSGKKLPHQMRPNIRKPGQLDLDIDCGIDIPRSEGSAADQDMTPNGKIKSPGIVLMLGNQQTPERSTLISRGASSGRKSPHQMQPPNIQMPSHLDLDRDSDSDIPCSERPDFRCGTTPNGIVTQLVGQQTPEGSTLMSD